MKTPALVVESPGQPFTYQEVDLDDTTLHPTEVLIRLSATGICHTDINFSAEESVPDLFPAILGHEGAGTVERIGSAVTTLAVGDRVVCVYSSCGECRYCQRRETSFCDLWFQYNFGVGRLDGSKVFRSRRTGARITGHFFGQSSFARWTVVKETGCVRIESDGGGGGGGGHDGVESVTSGNGDGGGNDSDRNGGGGETTAAVVPFEKLAPLGCGIMTGAGAMLNVVQPDQDMSVVVVGVGAVGLAAIMACKLLEHPPRKIIAVDIIPSRLELARQYGATHGVNSKIRPDLMKVLMDITDGAGVDGAIDTTGRPDVLKNLVHSIARKGKIVSVGVGQLSAEASMNIFEMVNAGCSYTGCNQGNAYPQEFIPYLLAANQLGMFPYDELVTIYAAKNINQAVQDMRGGKTVKAVLKWD